MQREYSVLDLPHLPARVFLGPAAGVGGEDLDRVVQGEGPQPEPLTPAWWWLRQAWILACAICLIPFVLGFRWAERPAPVAGSVGAGTWALGRTLAGVVAAAAGLGILASQAFPVPGEDVALPALGAGLVVAGAALLGVDPVAPLRARRRAEAGDPAAGRG